MNYEPKDNCETVSKINDPNNEWMMYSDPKHKYLIRCYDKSIVFTGSGIYRVRTSLMNSFRYGLIDILNSNFQCSSNNIDSCGSLSNETQLIRFRGGGTHTITGTNFKFCGINPYSYIENNNKLPENWDPSLIYISGTSTNSFYQVSFKHEKESPQAWEIRPTRPIRLEGDSSLNLTEAQFYNSSCFTEGSFLHLGSTKGISISLCNFQECYSEGGKAHAIYITDQNNCEVTINECEFLDCGKNCRGHVIRCEAPDLILSYSNFNFSDTNCSGCVYCYKKGKYHFKGNKFTNAKLDPARNSPEQYVAIGIHYEGQISNFDEDLAFDENYFNHIIGINYGRCLSAAVQEGNFTVLTKNTIENCPLGGFCVKIMQRKKIETFELNGWLFKNNYVNDPYGGGAGIWIENEAIGDSYTHNYTLIIKECNFENNTCGRKGGGFQMGYANDENKDKYVTRVEIQMTGCYFINNTANEEGGALAIQTNYPLTITNCHFITNKSPVNGGAIFIGTVVPDQSGNNQQMPYATITGCEFIGNSGHNSHCIYILDAPNTPIDISDCQFSDNYDENYHGGACILSNAISLTVKRCNFVNNDLEHSSGGVNVTSRSNLIISGTNFIHCDAGSITGSYGGGIGYCTLNSNDESRNEHIEITDCTIDGNGGANGVAIGLKPFTYPVISDIRIKNHVLTNWIFFIFFQFETEGDFTLDRVIFENNSYDSGTKSEFGGGTGIWIAESEDIDYLSGFNLVFEKCDFLYNRSPENGGAISYGGSPRLQSVEMTFANCTFKHNRCEHYYGGACRFETNKPVSIISCIFDNNTAAMNSDTGGSGGGAIFIGETVQSILIDDCNFSDCFAYRGSFIFTNGALKNISISRNFFSTLRENQKNSVYIEVDSQVTDFYFDSNQFRGLQCVGEDGGAGLHITNGAQIEISNCKFYDCIGAGDKSGMIRIPSGSNTGSQLIFNLCDFNNEQHSLEASARAVYIAGDSSVKFNSCRFLSFEESARDGAVLYSESQSSTTFFNCSFLGLKGKCLMKMENAIGAEILNCQFSSCQVGQSLMIAEKATNYTVAHCIFNNDNEAIRFGSKVANGLIYNNSFEQCSSNSYGGAVYINGAELNCDILENNFTRCTAGTDGLAIYIKAGDLINIHDCKFTNNYNQGSDLYTIYSSATGLNFYDSIIEYPDNYYGCGIKIGTLSTSTITNIKFKNLHRPSAIEYSVSNTEPTEHKIVVSECLFSEFQMMGGASDNDRYSCFNFGDKLNAEFVNNTIEYQMLPEQNWPSLLIGKIENKIENCIFSHNEVNGRNSGGTGVQFSGPDVQIINCEYYFNHAYHSDSNKLLSTGGVGGAIQIGYDSKTISVEISDCTFENNYADYEGGALAIQCNKAYIHDSTFINNAAAREKFDSENNNFKMGGAIYFNNEAQTKDEYRLSNCVFKQNNADSNGHAIFITGVSTNVFIGDLCLFEDNSANGGSQIFVNNKDAKLDFSNSTVHLKNTTSKTRGIEVSNGQLVAHHTTFSKVQAANQGNLIEGNAILVNDGDNSAEITDNTFMDCYIDAPLSYAVTFNGSSLYFANNVFDFSKDKGCGCLRIYCFGNVRVHSNTFRNAITPQKFGGVFMYEETVRRPTANNQGVSIRFNTFEGCSSAQTACFRFKWVSDDYQFLDNTFQNNNLKNYLGEFDFMGKKFNGSFKCGGNRFINNTARSTFGGGSGLWFQNKPSALEYLLENHITIFIEDCEFNGNHAVHDMSANGKVANYENGHGGALQLGFTESMSNIDVVFRNTTFINNLADREGGALSLQVIGYVLIDGCTFDGNSGGQNPAGNQYEFGGAVYFLPDFNNAAGHYSEQNGGAWVYSDNITLLNSKFVNNRARDATAVYISTSDHTKFIVDGCNFKNNDNANLKNYTIVSKAFEFYFERSEIEFDNRSQAVAGIRSKSAFTLITESNFTNNCISDNSQAESVFIERDVEEVEISGSTFLDCGKNNHDYPAVKLFSPLSRIERNVFDYTSNQNAGHAVMIKRSSDVNFYGNTIRRTRCKGALRYEPNTEHDYLRENLRIEGCTFDDCQGSNSRALHCILNTPNFTFYNNTIQNFSPYGDTAGSTGYIWVFEFERNPTQFVVDSIIFRNLTTDSDFGGGCGAWIKNKPLSKYTLVFKDCVFEENRAVYNKNVWNCNNGKGGALQYGWTNSISNIDFKMENCKFIGNKADQEGGALCLMLQGYIDLVGCEFINNTCGLAKDKEYYGGAINIIPNYGNDQSKITESITIDGCSFIGNLADEGNAIYVNKAPQTDLIITNDCNFLNNTHVASSHGTVVAETRKLEVVDSLFVFTTPSVACNAILTNATTVVIEASQFFRCLVQPIHGNALRINEGTKTCTVNGCKFINNGDNKGGSVIYTEASTFVYSNNEMDFTNIQSSDRGIAIEYTCKFSITGSRFHNCATKLGNTGAALDYRGVRRTAHTEEITIENVIFDSNRCNYASTFFLKPVTIPTLKNITAKNHRQGNFGIVIIFQSNVREDIVVEGCTFDNNFRGQSSERIPDCGGSGLWIACANQSAGYLESYRLIFNQCKFTNNRNNYNGGAFAYGYSPTLRYIFLDFNDCTFEGNQCDGSKGGALSFNGQVPVTITRSTFKGNKCNSTNYRGHCIYVDTRCRAIVNDCVFTDNGVFGGYSITNPRSESGHSIIQCSGAQLELNRCVMNFTDPTIVNSRFIDIDYFSTVNLFNTTFANCNAGPLWGGAIHFNKEITSIVDEQITIDSCIFDNNDAANGCAGLLNTSSVPNLINLTFRNENKGKYIFAVFFVAFRDVCNVENTVFENCSSVAGPNGEDGGGSAIWIANQEEISHGRPFELIYSNCTWRNNHASERGGAVHYGNSKTLVGVQMTFDRCVFDGNHATKEGGAVSLTTRSPIVFTDCTFRNNYVEAPKSKASGITTTGTKGGSISINSKTPLVSISGCSFTNETSDDGNAIFIHSKVQACMIIGCVFKNCGKIGTVIVTETIEFMLVNTEVIFDRRLQSCRGLEIRTISLTTISLCKFKNCHSEDIGGAIYLNNTLMSEEQEDFTLEDTVFDACEADQDGCAFYLNVSSSPVLRKITFQNHRFDKNVSVILSNVEFQDLYTIDTCTFTNNLFQNTREQDGGGSGIFIANGFHSELESSYKLSFIGCTWKGNTAAYGGAFSSGNNVYHQDTEVVFERCTFTNNIAANNKGGALYLKSTQQFLFDECTFNNNRCHNPDSPAQKYGGAIYIVSSQSVTITHTKFTENYGTDGNALWVEDIPIVDISDSTFTSNNNGRVGSQICTKCQQLALQNTVIQFNEKKSQARGLHIFRHCMSSFSNCQFLYCNISENGGAIYVTNDSPENNRTESLTLTDCTFNKCDASNGAVIQGYISCNPTISGCTVSKCNGGHYIISLFFETIQQFVTVQECTFVENYFAGASTSDAGGIGLWIAHQREMSVDKFSLAFEQCHFISNKCGKNGGAFAYGESPTLKNISLQFNNCVFNGNTCNGGNGGALYLSVEQQITISSCNFVDNKCNGANTKGSAIYVNSPAEMVSIRDSTFDGGQAIDGAVFAASGTNNLVIQGSTFNNCGSSSAGSAIHSEASKFTFQSSTVFFEETASIKCRAIKLQTKAQIVISEGNFYNCQSTDNGGGLLIDMSRGSREESLMLSGCTFENNDAKNGCAFYIQTGVSPTLEKITIRNSTSGNYVGTIIFSSFIEEATLKEGVFEFNEFVNNGFPPVPDGGGSGLWIANQGKVHDDKYKKIIFESCLWHGNKVKETSSLKYGGGYAIGTSLTTRITETVFKSCRFINNKAQERGGGLYIGTSEPVLITGCLFDGNEAEEGSNLYTESTSNVTIEYTQIVRNKGGQKGSAFIKSNENLKMLNVTFSENVGAEANAFYLINEGKAIIENCNFDISRESTDQYGIGLHGESSSASIEFKLCCFTHKGDDDSLVYISSSHKGSINFPAGNCFDLSESASIRNNGGGSISKGSGIFNCNKCGSIYVPTIAPVPTPSQTPRPTSDAQIPTESIPTSEPTTAPATSSQSATGGSSSTSKKKMSTKMIAMIAGIAAAVVVLIVVIIILLWLFVFRKKSKEADKDSENASEMNDEQVTEITGIVPEEDDPIWAGTNQSNPLFNGGEEGQDDEQMPNNDFEESWGVI